MKMIEVWINCPDRSVADTIAEHLVSRRIAACTNCLAEIESRFHWNGTIEEEREVPLVAKTREELFERLVAEVRVIHPYEIPSVIGLPVEMVNADYLEWVYDETVDP